MSSLDVVHMIMQHLSTPDLAKWSALMDDDALIETPFSPPWLPRAFRGRAEWEPTMLRWFGDVFHSFEWIDLDLRPAADPEYVYGTGKSKGLAKSGAVYQNEYSWIFRIQNGKMTQYTEYFNPLNVLEAFGDEQGARSIGRKD